MFTKINSLSNPWKTIVWFLIILAIAGLVILCSGWGEQVLNLVNTLDYPWNIVAWVAIGIVAVGLIVLIIILRRQPFIKRFLLKCVVEAEKALGSGTGQLKFAQVYAAFVAKFPIISLFLTEGRIKKWIEEALDWMEEYLAQSGASLLGNNEETMIAGAPAALPPMANANEEEE